MDVTIQIGTLADYEADIESIRIPVFVKEQNVPREIEMDERDDHCIHVLACIENKPVATGRVDIEKQGKIGRVAVLKDYRRRGIGAQVMQALEQIAFDHGLTQVRIHAQLAAQAFYESLGYQVAGRPFDEANIPHCKMIKSLP